MFQEIYSFILRIYKCGYLRGANKDNPKKLFFSGISTQREGGGAVSHKKEEGGGVTLFNKG